MRFLLFFLAGLAMARDPAIVLRTSTLIDGTGNVLKNQYIVVNEARIDFDQLFNNLVASGSSDRDIIVRSVLNELLYGWILEVKSEFGGTSLEKDVVALVNKLKR